MVMTDEERFRFDLTGFLVRPGILSAEEVEAIKGHVDRIFDDWKGLPPEHRGFPGGPSSVLIDHPKVIDVIQEVIGPHVRLDGMFAVRRARGADGNQPLHQGGRLQADPIFGYRVQEGRIFAGIVRVVFELTDVKKEDGATRFLVGSHKSNFPIPPEHMPLDEPDHSEFLVGYDCPAGSAIFFTENLAHAGPTWKAEHPRYAVLSAYGHVAVRFHRPSWSREVFEGLPPEKRAYLREPWMLDFTTRPPTANTEENFLAEMASQDTNPRS